VTQRWDKHYEMGDEDLECVCNHGVSPVIYDLIKHTCDAAQVQWILRAGEVRTELSAYKLNVLSKGRVSFRQTVWVIASFGACLCERGRGKKKKKEKKRKQDSKDEKQYVRMDH
jgi:hypothetical protein